VVFSANLGAQIFWQANIFPPISRASRRSSCTQNVRNVEKGSLPAEIIPGVDRIASMVPLRPYEKPSRSAEPSAARPTFVTEPIKTKIIAAREVRE